ILNRFNDRLFYGHNAPYIQDQMSGTCVFSGLSAYLRIKLKNELAYYLTTLYTGKALLSNFTEQCTCPLNSSFSSTLYRENVFMDDEPFFLEQNISNSSSTPHANEFLYKRTYFEEVPIYSSYNPFAQIVTKVGEFSSRDLIEPRRHRDLMLAFVRYM